VYNIKICTDLDEFSRDSGIDPQPNPICCINDSAVQHFNTRSDVKASRPDWPRGQNSGLGLGLDKLASAWPRSRPGLGLVNLASKIYAIQCRIILVVSILWLYHCNIHYKDVVKHSNVGQKFSYVFLALSPCVLIQKYIPVAGLDLGLGLRDLDSALALFNITEY